MEAQHMTHAFTAGDRWAIEELSASGEDVVGRIRLPQHLLLARRLLLPQLAGELSIPAHTGLVSKIALLLDGCVICWVCADLTKQGMAHACSLGWATSCAMCHPFCALLHRSGGTHQWSQRHVYEWACRASRGYSQQPQGGQRGQRCGSLAGLALVGGAGCGSAAADAVRPGRQPASRAGEAHAAGEQS